ncbi:transglutaminase-like domain-containing protein [Streptobacillus canis]|uniref:transglutaminase-like domain-containing protein n=1 Tax=Streptobacillus canis TaxID=2678686 RepID=UPI0012E2FF4D|nr:transglutaminase-like domain-containing protein [Streptobacillus canis]
MFKIKKEMLKSINFLLHHNYVPMIRKLEIENISDNIYENLSLKIHVEPEFARTFVIPLGIVHPGENIEIDDVNIKLIPEYLYSINELSRAQMFIEIYMIDEKIYEETIDIDLEPYNQWLGVNIMPETIISFSTPNHPKISEIVVKASNYLKKWGFEPSFTAYMSGNQNNVKIQMAAIYAALQESNIIYNIPPASYEVFGQKIRLPHSVLDLKQGTCLDLAMLYISCLEAIGLNPLLIIIEGHAYVGCWLEENTFSDIVIDDVSAIEKRIVDGLEEIILVEATDFVSGKNIDFDRAIKHGKDHLLDSGVFYLALDIVRGRGIGILPIKI